MFEKEEQYRLLKEVSDGSEFAKEELVSRNMGLVKSIAFRFSKYGYETEDLVQTGCIGLVKAIERFDMSYDVKFSTYALPLIAGEIRRFIRDDGRIRISRDLKYDIMRMKNERERYIKEKGNAPKLSELEKSMGMSREKLLQIIEAEECMCGVSSLDDPDIADKGYGEYGEENEEEKRINKILIKGIIENLPPRERQIIIMRYYRGMTQSEIAEVLKISQVHVSRLERRTLAVMSEAFGQDK